MKHYTVVYERAKANWAAYVPDLPGCITTGKTLEETQENIKEAISLYIETLKADGVAVPEPTTQAGTVPVAA